MKQMTKKTLGMRLREWANHEANIWLTVAAVLFIIVMAWLFNSKIGPLASDAAGLPFLRPQVVLVDAAGKPYPDVISIQSGESIMVGFRSFSASNCNPSWAPVPTGATSLTPRAQGPFAQNTTLTVTCAARSGSALSDRLQVNVSGQQPVTSGFAVTSPTASDLWQIGQTYTIAWQAGDTDCVPGVVDCFDTVTISLSPKAPDCVTATDQQQCLAKLPAPFTITSNAPNTGSYSWLVPRNLDQRYWGKQQITVTKSTGARAVSGEFSIVTEGGDNPKDTPPVVESAVKVLAPNGGESWALNSNQTIRWSGPAGKYTILAQVYPPSCTDTYCKAVLNKVFTIARDVSGTSFTWTVGRHESGTLPAGQYQIVVEDSTNPRARDVSDAPFNVGATGMAVPKELESN